MKNLNRTHLLAAFAAVCALLAGAAVAQAATTSNKTAVKRAVHWINGADLQAFGGPGFEADTFSALIAAKKLGVSVPAKTRNRFLDDITKGAIDYADSAGSTAKVITAAVAGGQNPRCFGPSGEKSDFYATLMTYYDEKTGQFGGSAFDQGFAMIALKAAHQKVPSKAVKFARNARGKYGWSFSMKKSAGDDVESSAIVIEGLRAAGVSRKDGGLRAGLKWITYQRNTDGGYNPLTEAGETQADTTSYAIAAMDAMGMYSSLAKKAKRAIRALQLRGGAIRSQVSSNSKYHGISTGNSVLALAGAHLPVVARSKAGNPCT